MAYKYSEKRQTRQEETAFIAYMKRDMQKSFRGRPIIPLLQGHGCKKTGICRGEDHLQG